MRALAALESAGFRLHPINQRRLGRLYDDVSTQHWEKVRREVLGQSVCKECDALTAGAGESYYLENLPRLFRFGYPLGREVCRLLGGEPQQAHRAGIVAGLFNAFASLFDQIYDDYPELSGRLGEIVDRGVLESGLSDRALLDPTRGRIRARDEDPIAVRVLCRLMEACFEQCRSAASGGQGPTRLKELRRAVLELHRDEIRSVDLLFDRPQDRLEVFATLRSKSVEPAWSMFLCSCLFAPLDEGGGLRHWRSVITFLGTALWIADDVADTVEDVVARRWNYVLLKAAGETSLVLGRRTASEILESLLAGPAVEEATLDMCTYFRRGARLLGETGRATGITRHVLVWMNRWIA